jgi:hypothetical protein
MIQSSRIVPFHARGESDSPHRVKKNVYLLMYGLIDRQPWGLEDIEG